MASSFRFKEFTVLQEKSCLKVGTDSMLLGALIPSLEAKNGLDLGAGTGVLSLMVAQRSKDISIDAIEIDRDSHLECRTNFENSPWPDRLRAHLGDYFEIQMKRNYDLIFSNPPYYTEQYLNKQSSLARAKHTDREELGKLLSLVADLLTEDGVFWMICPYDIYTYIIEVSVSNNLYLSKLVTIHSKEDKPNSRTVMAFSFVQKSVEHSALTIRNRDNSFTDEYIDLTSEYHFNSLNG